MRLFVLTALGLFAISGAAHAAGCGDYQSASNPPKVVAEGGTITVNPVKLPSSEKPS